MKQYSFLFESLDKHHEDVINDECIVYHGSQIKMAIIKGGHTQDNKQRFGYGCIYVTPYKYCAAHFIFDGDILYNEILKRNPDIKHKFKEQFSCGAYQKANWHYNGFLNKFFENNLDNETHLKTIQQSYPKNIDVYVNIKDKNDKPIVYKDFETKLDGYIHYINYNKYKDKSFFDNNKTQEFVIKGDVKPFKIDKITVNVKIHYWDGER